MGFLSPPIYIIRHDQFDGSSGRRKEMCGQIKSLGQTILDDVVGRNDIDMLMATKWRRDVGQREERGVFKCAYMAQVR